MKLPVDEGLRLLAAGYIQKQGRRLVRQLDGVRLADDIECVHEARVASRRLRAALRMFCNCFQARKLKRWRKAVRQITKGLGDARDLDVQIEFLCGVLDELTEKSCYPGIARLLVQVEKRRERIQPDVVKAVDRFETSGVLDEMRAVAKSILKEADRRGLGVQSAVAYLQTEQHILDRLNNLMCYEDSLGDPEAIEQHHAMRIAAKRLRYTVEIARPVYAGRLDETVTVAKRLQSMLGDIHDCDVWLEYLCSFAKEERARIRKRFGHDGPFERLRPGIDHLAQDRRNQREETFRKLVAYWQHLEQQAQWELLIAVIGLPPESTTTTKPQPAPASDILKLRPVATPPS